MRPEIYMMYVCHLVKHTSRFYLEPNIAVFLDNPMAFGNMQFMKSLVTQIRLEMQGLCRRKKWYEGEMEWRKFTVDDLISFMNKYDKIKYRDQQKIIWHDYYLRGFIRQLTA
jgi:hypothetical protein